MATHVISRRIQFLIQYVYNAYFPSKNDITEFLLRKDFKVSNRTLERDFERIRVDYGLEITYNKAKDGYFINEEKSIKVSSFFKFLEIVTVADILSESLKNRNRILEFVDFDDYRSFKGIEHLKQLLIAISQNRQISFKHENYSKNTLKTYSITPIFLKEFENRWYVIGVPADLNDIRTFGLDRIKDLEIKNISLKIKSQFSSKLEKFNNIIGLHYEDNIPIKIRLLVNGIHVKYMRSLPLHHSQVIHTENDKGQYFADFYLVPNYEFKTRILKMGPEAEVLFPKNLRLEIIGMLKETLKNYK